MADQQDDRIRIATLRFFFTLPDRRGRGMFMRAARHEARDALHRYSPDELAHLPQIARIPPSGREGFLEHARERTAEPYAALQRRAAANEELFRRRAAAAARHKAAEDDQLFREVVVARWLASRLIDRLDRAATPDTLADLGEARLPGGAKLRLVVQTGHRASIRALSFSPDGRWLVTASDDRRVIAWEAATGREVCTWWPDSKAWFRGALESVSIANDGKTVEVKSDQGFSVRWDAAGEAEVTPPGGPATNEGEAAPHPRPPGDAARAELGKIGEPVGPWTRSPAAPWIVAGTGSGALWTVDDETGKVVWSVPPMRLSPMRVAWDEDGHGFRVLCEDGALYKWDAIGGRLVSTRANAWKTPLPQGAFVLEEAGDDDRRKSMLLRDRATGTIVGYVDDRGTSAVTHLELSRDRSRLLLCHADGSMCVAELDAQQEWLSSPKPVWTARIRSSSAAALSPDGMTVIVGREDGVLQMWDVATKERLCYAIGLPDGRWAVSDEQGRYDASNGGDAACLHWVLDTGSIEVIELAQLKAHYYEPYLLAKKLGRDPEPLRPVTALADRLAPEPVKGKPNAPESAAVAALAPEVSYTLEDTPKGPKVHIVVTDRGGGIGPVRVNVNGKEAAVCHIEADEVKIERSVPFDGWSEAKVMTTPEGAVQMCCSFRFTGHPFSIRGAQDQISVTALDAKGAVASREIMTQVPAAAGEAAPARLWAIVAGVGKYAGEALKLLFSAKDAEDFAAALAIGAPALFGAERVHAHVLTTAREKADEQPTLPNLRAAFEEARGAVASDVLVVYLAGHGAQVHDGECEEFLFLTQEATTGDLSSPEARAQQAISGTELTRLLQQVPAVRQVMILDTCHAGQAAQDIVESCRVPSTQVRAIEEMKDRAGLFVLAGAAADAASLESSRYSQGLLTYSLLFGMRGPALQDGKLVDVVRLASYAIDEVPRLAEGIGGVQRPVLAVPRACESFDIGTLSEAAKAKIPLKPPRPIVVRGEINEVSADDDTTGVGDALDVELRQRGAGRDAPFVFVAGGKFPGAYRLTGKYTAEGDKVIVTLRLKLDQSLVLDEVRFEGTVDALEGLAKQIVDAVTGALTRA